MYHTRFIACSYSQVLCVNFSENYLPVMNDITFCILLKMVIHFRFSGNIVKVKIAFLYGYLEEEFYMEFPPGMKELFWISASIA